MCQTVIQTAGFTHEGHQFPFLTHGKGTSILEDLLSLRLTILINMRTDDIVCGFACLHWNGFVAQRTHGHLVIAIILMGTFMRFKTKMVAAKDLVARRALNWQKICVYK